MKISMSTPNIDVKPEEANINLKLGIQRVNEATNDYNKLDNKPLINNIELINNKTLDELNIQVKGDYPDVAITNSEIEDLLNNFV